MAFTSATNGVAVGTCMSVYRTTDAGATWTRDETTGDIGQVNGVHFGDGLGLAVGRNAIFQPTVLLTTDGGASFDWRTFYLTDPSGTGNEGALTDVRVLGGDVAVAVASVWSGEGAIARSVDAGDTWETVGWLASSLWGLDLDGARGIAVGNDGTILVSTDAGATWTPRASGAAVRLTDVAMRGSTAFAIGLAGTALRSQDGGETWLPLATGTAADLDAIAFHGSAIVVAGAAGTILRSTDDGLTWTPEPSLASSDLAALAFTPAGAGFAGGTEEILTRATLDLP